MFGSFGDTVAVDADRVVVGAPFENDATGGAYVFQYGRLSGSWVLTDHIVGGGFEESMGASVAAYAGRVLVVAGYGGYAELYETVTP
jgi:hypothetical protein